MPKALITTIPFAEQNKLPRELLVNSDIEFVVNPLNRKLKEDELADMISDYDAVIAGTEPITRKVLDRATKLKIISRVGIGLDNVDLIAAEEKGIRVCYTPDAPAPAVAELTIGLILSLLRDIHLANINLHNKKWIRHFGRRIPEVTIGIIGIGRIGGRVIRRLNAFGTPRLIVNDIHPNNQVAPHMKLEWVGKEQIYSQADVITLHLPLSQHTKNMITKKELMMMKPDACIINTSRGGIINESDLAEVLNSGHLNGAALDVFENEPYDGPLCDIPNCLLTSHMGSMSIDCRSRMEIEATEEILRFFKGNENLNPVPKEELEAQRISNLKFIPK